MITRYKEKNIKLFDAINENILSNIDILQDFKKFLKKLNKEEHAEFLIDTMNSPLDYEKASNIKKKYLSMMSAKQLNVPGQLMKIFNEKFSHYASSLTMTPDQFGQLFSPIISNLKLEISVESLPLYLSSDKKLKYLFDNFRSCFKLKASITLLPVTYGYPDIVNNGLMFDIAQKLSENYTFWDVSYINQERNFKSYMIRKNYLEGASLFKNSVTCKFEKIINMPLMYSVKLMVPLEERLQFEKATKIWEEVPPEENQPPNTTNITVVTKLSNMLTLRIITSIIGAKKIGNSIYVISAPRFSKNNPPLKYSTYKGFKTLGMIDFFFDAFIPISDNQTKHIQGHMVDMAGWLRNKFSENAFIKRSKMLDDEFDKHIKKRSFSIMTDEEFKKDPYGRLL